MNKNLELLIGSLDKANEIYSELIDISEKKRAYINDQKVDELEKLVNREMGLVGALYKLEDIRGKAADGYAKDIGSGEFKTITDLANQLPAEERRQVLDRKNKLLVGIKTVSEETRFNNKLLEDKIALIDLSIQMLTEGEDMGYEEGKDRKNIVDIKV